MFMRGTIFLLAFVSMMGCRTIKTEKQVIIVPLAKEQTGSDQAQAFARVNLESRSDSKAQGIARFIHTKDGVRVEVLVSDASPGLHALHIHQNGDCSAFDASSAGEHYNPDQHIHGAPDPKTHHLGDLGNIDVGADGKGVLSVVISSHHDRADWEKIVGKSLVLHGKPDDLVSQPSGASGSRIACGVISR